jgi:hypothetical protein
MEACAARDQFVDHFVPRSPQGLGHAVQEHPVAHFVLDLGGEGHLAGERWRPGNPFPLRQRAHDLGVGMHVDEAKRLEAVFLGHPLPGLDLVAGGNPLGEGGQTLRIIGGSGYRGHHSSPLFG